MDRWRSLADSAERLAQDAPRHPVESEVLERWAAGVSGLLDVLFTNNELVPELKATIHSAEMAGQLRTGRATLKRKAFTYGHDSRDSSIAALRSIAEALREAGGRSALRPGIPGDDVAGRAANPSVPGSGGVQMTDDELGATRVAVKAQGWFLTRELLGEGGGGVAYLAARSSALESIRAHSRAVVSEAAAEFAQKDNATSLVRTLRTMLAPGSDQFGVFKSAKMANERMKREINALSKLTHRNLVRVFAADPGDQPSWYLMEFFEAGDLTHSWPRFTGRAREVLTRTRELAAAVGVVHDAGLVHRDIKPDNIFIGDDGRWVLGDFGIAFQVGGTRHTEQGPTPMTKEWRPDWVVSRRLEEFTPSVDIFLLAKVAYAMIAGPGKNPPASQLRRPEFDLRLLHPRMQQVDAIQRFVADHVVANEEEMKSKDVNQFITRIDELLAMFEWRPSEQMVFSFLSSGAATHVRDTNSPLNNVDIRLPSGTTRLHLAVRLMLDPNPAVVRSMAPRVTFSLWHPRGEDLAKFDRDVAVAPDPGGCGHWMKAPLELPPRLTSDWYRFAITAKGDILITGFMIYAEAQN